MAIPGYETVLENAVYEMGNELPGRKFLLLQKIRHPRPNEIFALIHKRAKRIFDRGPSRALDYQIIEHECCLEQLADDSDFLKKQSESKCIRPLLEYNLGRKYLLLKTGVVSDVSEKVKTPYNYDDLMIASGNFGYGTIWLAQICIQGINGKERLPNTRKLEQLFSSKVYSSRDLTVSPHYVNYCYVASAIRKVVKDVDLSQVPDFTHRVRTRVAKQYLVQLNGTG